MSEVEKRVAERVETDVDEERHERGRVETENATEQETIYLCDLCGHPMLDLHCKLICERCGYKRDCSDP